jgi:hypothetical protein
LAVGLLFLRANFLTMTGKLLIIAGCFGLLLPASAQSGYSPSQARPIRFAAGTKSKTVVGVLTKKQDNLYYRIRTRAGQSLSLKATAISGYDGIIPLVFVTTPSGLRSTEKQFRYDVASTEAGDYLVRVAPNLMASNGDTGRFRLKVWAR